MIHKKQTLQVLGRRNKQQILKETIRPPASSTMSQITSTPGSGIPGGVGGCAGGPDSVPVPTSGGGLAWWRTCGSCPDPEDDSLGCYPNYILSVSNTGVYSTPVEEREPVDGQAVTTVAYFPPMTGLPDTDQSPITRQTVRLDIYDGCSDMERKIWRTTLYLDGDSVSDAPVWSPFNQFGWDEEAFYLSPEPGYDQHNIDYGGTSSVQIEIDNPWMIPANYDPLGYEAASGNPLDWIGVSRSFRFWDSSKQYPGYNLMIGAESMMNQWVYSWSIQVNSSSGLYPGVTYYLPTGLTNPGEFPFTITQYSKSPWDGTGTEFVKGEFGSLVLYSLPAGASTQMGATGPTDWLELTIQRSVSDPNTDANINFGDRPPGQLQGLNVNISFTSQAGGRDFDNRDTQAETTLNYEPGRSYSAVLSGNPDRTIYEPPTGVSFYSAVWVNGVRMIEDTHYTVDSDTKFITFSPALLDGDIVEVVFVAA